MIKKNCMKTEIEGELMFSGYTSVTLRVTLSTNSVRLH